MQGILHFDVVGNLIKTPEEQSILTMNVQEA